MKVTQNEVWLGTINLIVLKVKSLNNGYVNNSNSDSMLLPLGVRQQLYNIKSSEIKYNDKTKNNRIGMIFFLVANFNFATDDKIPTLNFDAQSRIVNIVEELKSKLVDAYQMINNKKLKGEFNVIACLRQTGVTTTIVSDLINGRFDYMFVRNHNTVKSLLNKYKSYEIKDLKKKIINVQSMFSNVDLVEFRGKKLAFDNCTPFYGANDRLIGYKECIDSLFQAFGDPVFDELVTIKLTREISELIGNSADTRMYFTM